MDKNIIEDKGTLAEKILQTIRQISATMVTKFENPIRLNLFGVLPYSFTHEFLLDKDKTAFPIYYFNIHKYTPAFYVGHPVPFNKNLQIEEKLLASLDGNVLFHNDHNCTEFESQTYQHDPELEMRRF